MVADVTFSEVVPFPSDSDLLSTKTSKTKRFLPRTCLTTQRSGKSWRKKVPTLLNENAPSFKKTKTVEVTMAFDPDTG